MHMFRALPCLLTIIVAQRALALRCKCTTSKGASKCDGDFCDVHGTSDKRAACGVVRVARQTHFACVHIKRTSNDTFCHVIKSATACWCRSFDFCNVELESELFDVDAEEEEQQEQSFDEESFEDEIPHDTFIITATRLDDMKMVELKTATRLDTIDHFQITPDTKPVPPSFSPDHYFDIYGEELDEGDDDYESAMDNEHSADSFSVNEQQEVATSTGLHQKKIETVNENQQSAVILRTATILEPNVPSPKDTSTPHLQTTVALHSVMTPRASTTTQPTASTSTTTTTKMTITTAPYTTTSQTTMKNHSNNTLTETTKSMTTVENAPSTTTPTTTTTTTSTSASTTPHPSTTLISNENPDELVDDVSDEKPLPESRLAHVGIPISIEKIGDGFEATLNRRANAPLSGDWEAIAPGAAIAASGRGSPSPTRIYSQSVPKTVLDKWTTHHHYFNSASTSTASSTHTSSLSFVLFANMLFSLLVA